MSLSYIVENFKFEGDVNFTVFTVKVSSVKFSITETSLAKLFISEQDTYM